MSYADRAWRDELSGVLPLSGFDRAPCSIGARLLSVVWFTFVSIWFVTFTAATVNNFTWASTVRNKDASALPFQNLEELIMHPDYKVRSLWKHYSDVIIGTMVFQITSPTIVYSTVYSGAAQRKYQSSASLAFVWGIHR